MQDGFVADAGDFGKYGLLRVLCNIGGSEPGRRLRLGVVWCYVQGNSLGKHIEYSEHRHRDPELYKKLREILSGRRSLASVEKSGILGRDTKFCRAPLNHKGKGARLRIQERARWLESALHETRGCEVVFLDPDNGLNPSSIEKSDAEGPSYVYLDEIARFVEKGRSVIVYQHRRHEGTTNEQITHTLRKLRKIAPSRTNPFAVWYRVRSSRMYFVLPTAKLQATLRSRADHMVKEKWKGPFEPRIHSFQQRNSLKF